MIGLNISSVEIPWPDEMTHYRVWDAGAAWCQIHVAPGVYHWERLDDIMAKAAGRHVTYVIGGCPRWLAKYPDQPYAAPWLGQGSNSMPWSLQHFGDFLHALVDRHGHAIDAYEIWNEPQLADFLYPYTPAELNALAQMTQLANTIIKGETGAMTLAAAVLPRESSGGMTKVAKYLTAMKAKGWNVDAMTCHIYPEVGTGFTRWKNMLQDVVSSLAAAGAPSRLWITETAYGLLGPAVPDDKARQLVTDTYAQTSRFIYWYAYHRPDLGGMQVDAGTAAWSQITTEGT